MKKDILVVVDVQPYYDGSNDIIEGVIEKINNTEQPTIVLWNGTDVTPDSKDALIGYYLEHGLYEEKLNTIRFIEKDYAFFRDWMDIGVSDELIKTIIKEFKENNITDCQSASDEEWDNLVAKYPQYKNLYELKEHFFSLPTWNTKLLDQNDSFELIGGGYNECLKEIALYLEGTGKDIYIEKSLTYGRETHKKKNKKHKSIY